MFPVVSTIKVVNTPLVFGVVRGVELGGSPAVVRKTSGARLVPVTRLWLIPAVEVSGLIPVVRRLLPVAAARRLPGVVTR